MCVSGRGGVVVAVVIYSSQFEHTYTHGDKYIYTHTYTHINKVIVKREREREREKGK